MIMGLFKIKEILNTMDEQQNMWFSQNRKNFLWEKTKMAFQVSPGVQVREIDVTNVVPAVSSTIGAFAGEFSWGPVDEVRTITSEKELVSVFGAPKEAGSDGYNTVLGKKEHFYSAANFLKYGNNLKVVRASNGISTGSTGEMLNATTGSAGLLIKNSTHYYESNYHTGLHLQCWYVYCKMCWVSR